MLGLCAKDHICDSSLLNNEGGIWGGEGLRNLPESGCSSAALFKIGKLSSDMLVNITGEKLCTVGNISADPSYEPVTVSTSLHVKDGAVFSFKMSGSKASIKS